MVDLDLKMDDYLTYKIAIVGFGPKGFYGLERLLANLNLASINKPIEIHIFNTTHFFGAGDVYRNDQPQCLIMNYANSNINVWPSESPNPILSNTPDFVTWLKNEGFSNLGLHDYAPRAMVGDYLMFCFQTLINKMPTNVRVMTHVGTVKDVNSLNGDYNLVWSDRRSKKKSSIICQKVLFTTGHTSFKPLSIEKISNENKVQFIYPTNERLKHLASNSSVAIKGFGLTAIDAILALTEARGGVFKEDRNGFMSYEPSGREPRKIYVFSRTGIPMMPRNGLPNSNYKLRYFTDEVIENLQHEAPIDFNSILLPLIKKEFYFAFYRILFQKYGHDLLFDVNFDLIEHQVRLFHQNYPNAEVFSWGTIVNPFENKETLSTEILKEYFEFLINEAQLGEEVSPFMAAVSTWRKINPIFNKLYSYGGLDADSHREFDNYYFGLFNRLAYGPPINNMKKLLGLLEAELLDFTFAKSAYIIEDEHNEKLRLLINKGSQKVSIDYYVNATIPRAREGGFENELYQNLKQNGLIKQFENKGNSSYKPGCLAINENGNPIDINGEANTDFTFYGTPTEGITFDNDTLSRSRNDFASAWAKIICEEIIERENRKEIYERQKHIL
ncbi:FAD/NAD(P)-binding protein [uncultured Maribacter sp.]|uniref:FAD/NAD(P)-binding protein n=1 Tax=uncultured Maribacter sp. TaxID=431308 RepID=UPI0030EF89E9|tara:strand:+ start:9823 stop:11664 length:1842 start_codon:yes stop_codon:yes gene_type:complete